MDYLQWLLADQTDFAKFLPGDNAILGCKLE